MTWPDKMVSGWAKCVQSLKAIHFIFSGYKCPKLK